MTEFDSEGQLHQGTCHYRGDVRDSDYIIARWQHGKVMRAVQAAYAPEADLTTIWFQEEADTSWGWALDQDEQAKRNLHRMWPVLFQAPS